MFSKLLVDISNDTKTTPIRLIANESVKALKYIQASVFMLCDQEVRKSDSLHFALFRSDFLSTAEGEFLSLRHKLVFGPRRRCSWGDGGKRECCVDIMARSAL